MSTNPMTGVGLARALRVWWNASIPEKADQIPRYPESLQLVGIDDSYTDNLCGLSDPVFDEVHSLLVHGKLRNRDAIPTTEAVQLLNAQPIGREVDEEALWATVVGMMGDENAFFLPVSPAPCLPVCPGVGCMCGVRHASCSLASLVCWQGSVIVGSTVQIKFVVRELRALKTDQRTDDCPMLASATGTCAFDLSQVHTYLWLW